MHTQGQALSIFFRLVNPSWFDLPFKKRHGASCPIGEILDMGAVDNIDARIRFFQRRSVSESGLRIVKWLLTEP